ncbi:MAG: hypothetical protein P8104_06095 [Gammaproteobacteria bacterium]
MAVLSGCVGEQSLLRYDAVASQLPNSSWSSDCVLIEHTITTPENAILTTRINLSEDHSISFQPANDDGIGLLEITAHTYFSNNCSGASTSIVMTGSYRVDATSDVASNLLPEPIDLTINGIHQSGTALASLLQLNTTQGVTPVQFISWNATSSEIWKTADNTIIMIDCPAPSQSLMVRIGRDATNTPRLEMPNIAFGIGSPFYANLLQETTATCPESAAMMPPTPEINADTTLTTPSDPNNPNDPNVFNNVLTEPAPNSDPNAPNQIVSDTNDQTAPISEIGLMGVEQSETALMDGLVNVVGAPQTGAPQTGLTATPPPSDQATDVRLTQYLKTLETPFTQYHRHP